jgi:uncharacterized protein (TIGR02001 family)
MNKLTARDTSIGHRAGTATPWHKTWRPMLGRFVIAQALAIFATLAIWPTAANAQKIDSATPPAPSTAAKVEPATNSGSTFDINVSASVTSDYNYRGYTLSDHRPSASTNWEATYNIFFAGINAASVQMPMLSQIQTTSYGGIRPVFGNLTVETGVGYFSYPGSPIDISYPEYYIAPSYALTPQLNVGVNIYYAPDYSRTGAWENYDSVTAKYTFGDTGLSVSGELGRQSFGTTKPTALAAAVKLPDYTYWNFGFAYNYKVLTFDLRYFATTLSKQDCNLITGTAPLGMGSNSCTPAIIGTLSWSANLSGLK